MTARAPKVCIIGDGFVGRTYANLLARYSPVMVGLTNITGPDRETTEGGANEARRIEVARSAEIVFICVPTNSLPDGSCDTSIVKWWLARLTSTQVICIKSTVPPGSTGRWRLKYGRRLVFSPEFAGESSYYVSEQYLHPTKPETHPFVVVGGPDPDTKVIIDLLQRVLGPEKQYIMCRDPAEAEMMKYVCNTFGAMKVAIFHEFSELCERLGLSYHAVRSLALLDPRIGPCHTADFGQRGFGGKCLPKESNALVRVADDAGAPMEMLRAALRRNADWRGDD